MKPKAVAELADQLECLVLANREGVSKSTLRESLESAYSGVEPWDSEDDTYEDNAELVFQEIELRRRLLGEKYPFTLRNQNVVHLDEVEKGLAYLLCLGLSVLPPEQIDNDTRTRFFESTVLSSLSTWVGGKGVRVGFPQDEPYEDCLKLVAGMVAGIGDFARDARPGGSGDAGWDVIHCVGFPDRRVPELLFMVNCATGRRDYIAKGQESGPVLFWDSFDYQPSGSVLVQALAVPFVMSYDELRRKVGNSNIIFDRFRVALAGDKCTDGTRNWVFSKLDVIGDACTF